MSQATNIASAATLPPRSSGVTPLTRSILWAKAAGRLPVRRLQQVADRGPDLRC